MKRLLQTLAIGLTLSLAQGAGAAPFSAHYVFGDSLSDAGNLFLATGGALPQPGDYYQGHFSNGTSYAERVSIGLGLPGGATPSYAGGTNYAVGGARTDNHILGTPAADAQFSLQGQINSYFSSHAASDPNALYTVWIGSNDVLQALQMVAAGQGAAAQARVADAVGDIAVALGQLVGSGARHLLLPNITDLGLTPRVAAMGPMAQVATSQMVMDFNTAIDGVIAGLSASTPGLDVIRFDTFHLLREVMANAGDYGFTDFSACISGFVGTPSPTPACSNPDQHIFWDDIHPTSATAQILADRTLAALVPAPATLALALLALGVLGVQRRRR
ncbi:MAG: SGNH/GDSL hydrolase family protein [Moraxellaceae bacterium]|nr:SGNH/GDSL hydrolase family protein [Moraxellaceae bacterium]